MSEGFSFSSSMACSVGRINNPILRRWVSAFTSSINGKARLRVTRWIKNGHLKAKTRGTARTEQQNDDIYLINGLRNSHDKSFRLSCTVCLRIFVCENLLRFTGNMRLRQCL